MKKILVLIICICLTVAAFLIIGGTISGDDLTPPPSDENEKIYIGVYESLSGVNMRGGNQELLGLEFAHSERPSVQVNGETYDIEFVVRDNASQPLEAEHAAQRLLEKDISAVLGSYGSNVSIIGGEIFKEAGIPVIGISSTNPKVTVENDMYFSVCFTDDLQGKVMARYVYGMGLSDIALVTQAGDNYSKDLGNFFYEEFESLGGTLTLSEFNSAQTNFEDLAEEIINAKCDGVFMPSSPEAGAIFIEHAQLAGLDVPIFGANTWDTETLLSELGIYGEDTYFSSPYNAGEGSVDDTGFPVKFASWINSDATRIENNGGTDYATPLSALAYDAYTALANAIENGDSFQPEDIAEQLREYRFTGVTGDIDFNLVGNSGQKTVYIKTINPTTKEFELVQTIAAQ